MTYTVYQGPGTAAFQSTQYSVTINGSSAYVYGWARSTPWNTQGWTIGQSPYQSWVTWAADETVTVVVTKLSGPIASARVFPTEVGITKSISGGVLTLTIPANRRLQVEIDGNARDWLWLFASPPLTIPGGTTNWATYGPRAVSAVSAVSNTLTVPSGHGLAANERVRFHTSGTYPTAVGGNLTEADFYYVRNPLATTIELSRTSGGAAIDITSAGSGTMQVYRTTAPAEPLYFPAGSWRIGRLFDVVNGQPIYLDGSAHVLGSLDYRGCTAGSHLIGHGQLAANYETWENVIAAYGGDFQAQLQWAALYGKDDSTYNRDNRIDGVTIYGTPFYAFAGYEFTEARNVHVMAGWTPNNDGFDLMQKTTSITTASIIDCVCFAGDDGVKMDGDYLSLTVNGLYSVQSASAAILIDYFGQRRFSNTNKLLQNVFVRHLQMETPESDTFYPTHCVIKAWVDANDASLGAWDVTIDGIQVVGDLFTPVLSMEVRDYPFGAAGTQRGQISNITIRNLSTETVPTRRSRIIGSSPADTPHDIALDNWSIGGVALTAANASTFIEFNSHPYNLYINGAPIADVWTTTGSWFASTTSVAPWSFLPASGRLGGSRSLLLPSDVAWPGTPTASRGVLPSIGSYDWGATSGQTGASLSAAIVPTHIIAATSTIAAGLSATVTPTHSLGAVVASTAALDATVTPDHTLTGAPIAAASLSATATPEHTLEAAATAEAALSVAETWQHTATATVESSAELAAVVDIGMAIAAAPTVEVALSATVEPAHTLAATAETPGELGAYLEVTIAPEFEIGATVEASAAASVTLPEFAAEIEAEALIEAATEVVVAPQWQIEAEALTPPELFASLSATVAPSFDLGAEVSTTAALTATLEIGHAIEAELFGVSTLRTGELDVIRTALLGMMGRSAATAGAVLQFEAEPKGAPPAATATIIRAVMLPVARQMIGHDGEPLIQQDGRLQIQVLFPRGTGKTAQILRLMAIARRYPEQTVVASVGVTLTGTADVRKVGQEAGRTRWDVTIPWRSMRVETAAADTERTTPTLQTVEGALEAVRTIWHNRIETAVPGEGWAGLRTYYDDVGPFEVPPPVPWAGVWTDAFGTSSRETSGPTETVLGQVMVQIHTDQSLGAAGATQMVNRIATEHNRQFRSVVVGVATVVGSRVTPAGTWQTTLRIPFRFEKARD